MSTVPPLASNWFSNFSAFGYDETADLPSNFASLATSRNWGARTRARRWVQCQTALFGSVYGTDTSDLTIWQSLCTDVGIPGAPGGITQCKKALGARSLRVNIVNLIEHRLSGVPVRHFPNYEAFKAYTMKGRTFPLREAKDDSFIKALLRTLC